MYMQSNPRISVNLGAGRSLQVKLTKQNGGDPIAFSQLLAPLQQLPGRSSAPDYFPGRITVELRPNTGRDWETLALRQRHLADTDQLIVHSNPINIPNGDVRQDEQRAAITIS